MDRGGGVERVEYTDIISFSICEPGGDTFNRRGKLGKLNFFLLSGVLSAKKNVNSLIS